MFDSDDMTDWHSNKQYKMSTKKLEITFVNRVNFNKITIMRTQSTWDNRYKNVCLVIDNNIENVLCTDSDTGFNGVNSEFITWQKPTYGVKTIALEFRTQFHARIADMKIFYQGKRIKSA